MKRPAALVALVMPAALLIPTAPAHADPCFVNTQKFSDWYDGTRWGTSLANVESQFNCVGVWGGEDQSWNGHTVKTRVWPRSDGGQTEMNFALGYSSGANIRAHDQAVTWKFDGTLYWRVCEWPRPDGNPCTPT